MFNKKNKKGISPLIATVLIIGFTIVLAALVITWGSNLFRTTVENTGKQADISQACSTGLNLEIVSATKISNKVMVVLKNLNPDRTIDKLEFVVYANDVATPLAIANEIGGDGKQPLVFPVQKTYNVSIGNLSPSDVNKIEVYPEFDIDNTGTYRKCSTPKTIPVGTVAA